MLVERPELVRGREVLEIGAGTGVCGIVAAKLGASKVCTHLISFLSASWTCSSNGLWAERPAVFRQVLMCQGDLADGSGQR